ncbi:MAG: Cysteine--tRNA ligase [Firmicutes bacterium]|nr:Cysteine--tRNA ligase [candidate division NPL-UPA2 bacterium]MBT9154237.1 Cysteine--tRNA ligase [candidate division NPL-UPA2 bacterium]
MQLQIYNTLKREKELFVPRLPGKVSMYLCGPTVYNRIHLGNARTFVLGDTIRRILSFLGYDVTYVQNFTDVDDKIIVRAAELNITVDELVEQEIKNYFEDAKALGILPADKHPRVTEHIGDIIAFIEDLIAHGFAYVSGGDVFYDVQKFPAYGQLSGQKLDDLVMGSRVEAGELKRYPADFALWKAAKVGEPYWQSPWGNGRPGWHIECSAMVRAELGGYIDIHAGGMDLQFPHHENELAQSEALCSGEPFARYWVHGAFLNVNDEKMSKSQGNFFILSDILKRYAGNIVRFFLQSAHYRKPLSFDATSLDSATVALNRLRNTCGALEHVLSAHNAPQAAGESLDLSNYEARFKGALADDFNTAEAWGVLFELARDANTGLAHKGIANAELALSLMQRLAGVLGVELTVDRSLDEEIEALIARREEARFARDYWTADNIRVELAQLGIVLLDTPQGVRWKYK